MENEIKVSYKNWVLTMQENGKLMYLTYNDPDDGKTWTCTSSIKYTADRGLHLTSPVCHLSDDTCEKLISKLQRVILKSSPIAKDSLQKMRKLSRRKHRHCYPLFAYPDGRVYMQGTIRGNTWYNDVDTINKLL